MTVSAENRKLQLELVSLKPVDFNKVNNKLLQRPPVITYENVDLNAIEIVKKILIGTIYNASYCSSFGACDILGVIRRAKRKMVEYPLKKI